MKMKKRLNGSPMKKRKRKSFNRITLFLNNLFVSFCHYTVHGSKKRAHSAAAFTPPATSPSPVASIPVEASGFYTSRDVYSFGSSFYTTSDLDSIFTAAILKSAPTSTPLASSAVGTSLRPAPLLSACPPTPAPSSSTRPLTPAPSSQGVVNSHILILQTADSNINKIYIIKGTCILTFAQLQQAIRLHKGDY
ncbi:hypothetical protein M9H77_36319 [Catharanthus roseus]|uniref:Uncharacterized protein n=1 Tax=Catharanthus roseus TaxID=4058 RepID=A0ACB9ZRH9_CATRO|nr:hypothetical protein M9H77_36319 [Catharanthus roseus]